MLNRYLPTEGSYAIPVAELDVMRSFDAQEVCAILLCNVNRVNLVGAYHEPEYQSGL